jgi:CheY-like chemotaxis protein
MKASSRRPKVLVVDDEPDVLESTALLIESIGCEAIRLSNAADVLDVAEDQQPALLLQDLKMPGLSVAGLVAALRSNPRTAEIPVVFFSANADLHNTAARYDAWGYLAKPFGKEELARLVERALEARVGAAAYVAQRDIESELRTFFHDYWNILAAITNYVEILRGSKTLPQELRRAVRGLDDAVLQIESKTDRLRAYTMSIARMLQRKDQPSSAPAGVATEGR